MDLRRVLYVSGIQRSITEDEIIQHFSAFGKVISFEFQRDKEGKSRGYGLLQIETNNVERIGTEKHAVKGASLNVAPAPTHHDVKDPQPSTSRVAPPVRGECRFEPVTDRKRQRPVDDNSGTEKPLERDSRIASRHEIPSAPRTNGDNCKPSVPHFAQANPTQDYEYQRQSLSSGQPDLLVCIPMHLCPASFVYDPRTCCAKLDPHQLGSLVITPKTL